MVKNAGCFFKTETFRGHVADSFARSKTEILRRQAGLADDGAGGTDGQFLFRMGNDGNTASGILVFGVAAALGDE